MKPKLLRRLKNACSALMGKPYVQPTVHIVRQEMHSETIRSMVVADRYRSPEDININDMHGYVRRELRDRIAWKLDEMGAMVIRTDCDVATGKRIYRASVEVLMPRNGGFDDESHCD